MKEVLILIPARYESGRFPGKPLAPLKNKPMIQYVYENCKGSGFDCYVVTDDERVEIAVKQFGGNVIRVDDKVESGSERVYLAYARNFSDKNYEYVINVQGDEPLLTGEELRRLLTHHDTSKCDIYTIVKKENNESEKFNDPNVVKAIYSQENGRCHFFSRASVPYNRENVNSFEWFHHIGVYSFRTEALRKFHNLPHSYYEKMECLEQLRAIEGGLIIGAVETELNLMGVDTKEDLKRVEEIISGQTK